MELLWTPHPHPSRQTFGFRLPESLPSMENLFTFIFSWTYTVLFIMISAITQELNKSLQLPQGLLNKRGFPGKNRFTLSIRLNRICWIFSLFFSYFRTINVLKNNRYAICDSNILFNVIQFLYGFVFSVLPPLEIAPLASAMVASPEIRLWWWARDYCILLTGNRATNGAIHISFKIFHASTFISALIHTTA